MMNSFPYSDDNKRYHTYNYYLKKRFGRKVCKIPLNIDLGCPNRDGTKGTGGCKFCSAKLSGNFAGDPKKSIQRQYAQVRSIMDKKWPNALYIPYFQAGSNTYGDTELLRASFETALSLENAIGISIATRADCIDREKAAMLGELAKSTYLTVELGLQTVFDSTALAMNRCHTFDDFTQGLALLKEYNINVCVHLIDGLPNESRDMMTESARKVGELGVHAVKLHLLHVLKDTELADMYERGEFKTLERDEYVQIICDQLEVLPPETVIERLTGDGDRTELTAPLWSRDKRRVLNEIDMEMARRGAFQGDLLVHG